mmetsp:Transcript_53005/g.134620  ORF Transcript_53005/g.134620 Transcript_53005/m.134620 type:complete len:243 (+) Transcript_53005:1681-2409(+)
MCIRWAHAGIKHQDALQKPGDTGASLQVADVGLGTREGKYRVPRLHGIPKRADLDRVSQRSPGAMALREREVPGLVAGLLHRRLDARLLRRPVRRRHRGAPAVLVDLRAQQASALLDPVLLILARLQVHEPNALPAGVAIARLIEGEAAAVWRDHAQGAHPDVGHRADLHANASYNGLNASRLYVLELIVELPGSHPVHPRACRHQRGGARRIGRGYGAAHVHQVGEPGTCDRLVSACQTIL